ncbi:hypothetical protein [Daejeonella lutea]|uniref:Uncharacterized protein n=1 Tax=Daejeonella lutea TaxID=572036 RepID=A0A1T5AZY1_9SPHI|nr:hypothetical protein [Daejeonella lutea]SKB40183.1 hypothetical protein SAMN05661099_1146 [Daejeonella lutea]
MPIFNFKYYGFKYYGWFTAIILLCFSITSKGQNSFGVRITPSQIVSPKVTNTSSALIYGERRLAFDAAVDYRHELTKNFSIGTGLNIGLIDFNHVMIAPVDAFGSGTGSGKIYINSTNDNFVYTGLILTPDYRFKIHRSTLHLSSGPNIRAYYGNEAPDVSNYAFNRTAPWNPVIDPADFEVSIPSAKGKLRVDLTTSLTIERRVSERTNILFGIRYNLGFKPISEGTMYVNMYGQRFDGRFDIRSSYIGLDLQLRYLTKAPNSGYDRLAPIASDNQDFRRAIYIDVLGSSPLGSINYDMRLKRHHNDGLGFRAGFGLGSFVQSDYTKTSRYYSLPIGVSYVVGPKRHGLEAGIGYTAQFLTTTTPPDVENNSSFANLNIGYRFQPLKDGLLFRLYWTPTFKNNDFYYDQPGDANFHTQWAGASIGFSFR